MNFKNENSSNCVQDWVACANPGNYGNKGSGLILASCSHKEPAHILPTTPNLAGCVIADDGPACHTTRDKTRRNGASMTNWLRQGTRIYRPNNAVHKCHRKSERPLRQKEFECIREAAKTKRVRVHSYSRESSYSRSPSTTRLS
jgi:hypothetical protein